MKIGVKLHQIILLEWRKFGMEIISMGNTNFLVKVELL